MTSKLAASRTASSALLLLALSSTASSPANSLRPASSKQSKTSDTSCAGAASCAASALVLACGNLIKRGVMVAANSKPNRFQHCSHAQLDSFFSFLEPRLSASSGCGVSSVAIRLRVQQRWLDLSAVATTARQRFVAVASAISSHLACKADGPPLANNRQ